MSADDDRRDFLATVSADEAGLLYSALVRLEKACDALSVGDEADARGGYGPKEVEAAQARYVARQVIAKVSTSSPMTAPRRTLDEIAHATRAKISEVIVAHYSADDHPPGGAPVPAVIADACREYAKGEIADAIALIRAVQCSEFDGMECYDVDGKNWFDARDAFYAKHGVA